MLTAEYDPLRDEGEAYAERLREAGVQATTKCYEGIIHGFLLLAMTFEPARQALDDAAAALHSAFER